MPHNVTIIKHQPWTLSVVLPVFICQPLLTWQYWWVAPSKTRTQHKGNVRETCFSSNGLCQIILYWDKKENITLSTLNTCIFSDHFLGSWYMISSDNILKPSPKAFALLFRLKWFQKTGLRQEIVNRNFPTKVLYFCHNWYCLCWNKQTPKYD